MRSLVRGEPAGRCLHGSWSGREDQSSLLHQGQPTEKIWYYDLSDVKVGKKTPFLLAKFDEFLRLVPTRAESERSWTVTRQQIEAKNYDLKAVNPNRKNNE